MWTASASARRRSPKWRPPWGAPDPGCAQRWWEFGQLLAPFSWRLGSPRVTLTILNGIAILTWSATERKPPCQHFCYVSGDSSEFVLGSGLERTAFAQWPVLQRHRSLFPCRFCRQGSERSDGCSCVGHCRALINSCVRRSPLFY